MLILQLLLTLYFSNLQYAPGKRTTISLSIIQYKGYVFIFINRYILPCTNMRRHFCDASGWKTVFRRILHTGCSSAHIYAYPWLNGMRESRLCIRSSRNLNFKNINSPPLCNFLFLDDKVYDWVILMNFELAVKLSRCNISTICSTKYNMNYIFTYHISHQKFFHRWPFRNKFINYRYTYCYR